MPKGMGFLSLTVPNQLLGEIPNLCNSLLAQSLILLHSRLSYPLTVMKPGEVVIRASRMRGSLKDGYG